MGLILRSRANTQPTDGANAMTTQTVTDIDVDQLEFDVKNPRLAEFFDSPIQNEMDIIKILWETEDVQELVMSITASGFFRHEPLIVVEESGKFVVIEGNRRLAAVKAIRDPAVARQVKANIPTIAADLLDGLNRLPCLIDTREDTWRFLGFKHVNGPAKWGSYAKARYVASVNQTFNVSLVQIAQQIGDNHNTVQRLFRGLKVIEQAEDWEVFRREDRWHRHFSFSHLYTGLDYPGISSYIGLTSEEAEDPEPVPSEKRTELGELCLWLYGSKRKDARPIIRSQNPHLRQLDAVLGNRSAVASLRNTSNLQAAFAASRPPTNRFEESLVAAMESLREARAMLSDGYDGSGELLATADGVVALATDLHAEMVRKQFASPRPQPART